MELAFYGLPKDLRSEENEGWQPNPCLNRRQHMVGSPTRRRLGTPQPPSAACCLPERPLGPLLSGGACATLPGCRPHAGVKPKISPHLGLFCSTSTWSASARAAARVPCAPRLPERPFDPLLSGGACATLPGCRPRRGRAGVKPQNDITATGPLSQHEPDPVTTAMMGAAAAA